jgi:hypothetical protein
MNAIQHVVRFDKTPRVAVMSHELVNHVVVQGLTLYNDGYRLRPCIVRGQSSMALDSSEPGEYPGGLRTIAHGVRALQYALILSRPVTIVNDPVPLENGWCEDTSYVEQHPWKLDSKPVHEYTTECGDFEPDYNDRPDIWEYGY